LEEQQHTLPDVETSTANTISTGTIDIAVNGQNPWEQTATVNIKDIKPCQTEYAEYVIKNVGSNPANIFKTIKNIVNGPDSEDKGNLSNVIVNDLSVWVYKVNPNKNPEVNPVWWQVIYTDEMDNTLLDLEGDDVLLGMLPVGWYMKVQQSYHMQCDAGNEYQATNTTFDIQLTAEQLRNTVTLENKLFPAEEYDAYSKEQPTIIHGDGIKATVEYDVKEKSFDYKLKVKGLTAGDYTLIAWPENNGNFAWADSINAIVLASVTVGSNPTVVEGSIDLNQDLINAKLWLIPGTIGTPGGVVGNFTFDESGLFETALMDYYDSLK
jgi:hypothetical protein